MNAGDGSHYKEVFGSHTSQDDVKPLHSLIFGPRVLKNFNQPKPRPDIKDVTYNSRTQRLILLDSRGCSSWSLARHSNSLRRELNFPNFQFHILIKIVFCKKFNVYFGLGKDRSLRVYNRNFEETERACTEDSCLVSHLLFNPVLNELITGGDCVRFWSFTRVQSTKLKVLVMSNYRLILRHEFRLEEGRWCTHMELDVPRQRLYFFSRLNILCYDMAGTLRARLNNAHSGMVLASVFSPYARMLLTASTDLRIKAWSETGLLIHVFHGHSRPITSLILHPATPAIFISASLDCSIRLWCLNSLTQIFSIPHLEGVLGLGLTEENLLYSWSFRSVQLYHLNHFLDFWGFLRYPALSFRLCKAPSKTNRLLTLGDGNSLHIFSCSTGKKLCLMPPHPFLSPLKELPSFAYDRQNGLIALLLSSWEVWMYTARTDPACRVAVRDVRTFQQSRAGSRLCLDEVVHLPKTDSVKASCTSLGFLNSIIYYHSVEGPVCANATSFLLCGMADGRILFMDITKHNLMYYELKVHKDPVVWLSHDMEQNCLMTMCEEGDSRQFQAWSLPALEALHQICVPSGITAFTWMEDLFFVGFHSGAVRLVSFADSGDGKENPRKWDQLPGSHSKDGDMGFNPYLRQDHKGVVLSVDSSSSLHLFLSCGSDTLIKLWDRGRTLLAEVQLDTSLSSACFLNPSGDLLVGFRLHLYKLPHHHFLSSSSVLLPNSASQASLADSFIYERPELTFDGKHDDPINMESYIEPYKGFDYSGPPQEEASSMTSEEDLESNWEVPHAQSLTYQSLESCDSVFSAASSQTLLLTPGQSLTDISKLLERPLTQEYSSSLSQSEGLDLWDMSTLPEAWPTESPDVTLDSSRTKLYEDLTASSRSHTKTSPPADSDNCPGDQGIAASRFANICISISDMKPQAKPQVKRSQMAVPDPPPPHPLPSPPLPHLPPPPPHSSLPYHPLPRLPPPPKVLETKKQLTDLPTGKSSTVSVTPSAKKQIPQIPNRKRSISKPSPSTPKLVKKTSHVKAKATQSQAAKAPKQDHLGPQRQGNGPRDGSSKQKAILKDRADREERKAAPEPQPAKKMADRAPSPPPRPTQTQDERDSAGGLCTLVDYRQRKGDVPEKQTDAAGPPLMVRKKQSRGADVTQTDVSPEQPAKDHAEEESIGCSQEVDLHAEPVVREPRPEEHEPISQAEIAVGWEKLHRQAEEQEKVEVCEDEESSEELSSSRSSSSCRRSRSSKSTRSSSSSPELSEGGDDVSSSTDESEEEEFTLVRPVSMTEVSRTSHHLPNVRNGRWILPHTDISPQKQASNEPLPPNPPQAKKKQPDESAKNWIDHELLRQMSLQRVRRERQYQVQEKRAALEQKRLQQLVRQPYHAFCGNINTGPDGSEWSHFSSQQGPGAVRQPPCDQDQGLPGRRGATPVQLTQRAPTHSQSLETYQPYRLKMPVVSQRCDCSSRRAQHSQSQNRILPLRPHSASIPSKGRFVLTDSLNVPVSRPPSQLEERLLRDRFPKHYRELSAKGILPSPRSSMF